MGNLTYRGGPSAAMHVKTYGTDLDKTMRRSIKRALKRALLSILVIGFALLAMRAYRSLGGPALQPRHTFVPMDDPL
jgi:hypothetical protein